MDELQEELQHLQGQMLPLQGAVRGARAAAEFSEDSQLYRAEVLGAYGADEVKVLFIDFGNREVVKTKSLLQLPRHLEEMKELAARVRVAGAREGGLGVELEEKLLEGDVTMLQDQDKGATFFVDGVKLDVSSMPQQSLQDSSEEMEILCEPAAVINTFTKDALMTDEEVTELMEEVSEPVLLEEPLLASPQLPAPPARGTGRSSTVTGNVVSQIKAKMESEMKVQNGKKIAETKPKKPVFQPTATLTMLPKGSEFRI